VPVVFVTSLEQAVRESLAEHRFRARLMLAFAALAGLFAVLGIYAVTSRSVASRARVMGMVVRQGVLLAGCGVALLLTHLPRWRVSEYHGAPPQSIRSFRCAASRARRRHCRRRGTRAFTRPVIAATTAVLAVHERAERPR
jgi:hypothetical protein